MYEQQLCAAIRERKAVKFRHDDDLMERTFEPYIVYWNDKRHELVAGYQTENPAKSLERDVWREFSLDKLRPAQQTLRSRDRLSGVPEFPLGSIRHTRLRCGARGLQRRR